MYVKNIEDKLGFSLRYANASEENRIKTATTIAAISRGKDGSNSPESRYKKLLKEAATNVSLVDILNGNIDEENMDTAPGRPLEFIPVAIGAIIVNEKDVELVDIDKDKVFAKITIADYSNLMKFSSVFKVLEPNRFIITTNMRALLNLGLFNYEDIPYNAERNGALSGYKAYEIKAPYFVFAQIRTHGQMSQVAVSGRVVDEEELWLPEDVVERAVGHFYSIIKTLEKYYDYEFVTDIVDKFRSLASKGNIEHILNNIKPVAAREVLKTLGYHKEIYSRFPNMLYYKRWIIAGSIYDKYQWGHLLLEREAFPSLYKSWVQPTTSQVAVMISDKIVEDIRNQ